jgi:glycosyltransferase involved in cell wall biosynthesis
MKVCVVYQYYQGHGAPGHSLVYELTQFLARRGHTVTVVSGETGYMDSVGNDLPWYKRLLRKERIGEVEVTRTYTYTQLHRSYRGRLLSFLSFSLSCPLGLLLMPRPDVVVATSPPIFPMFSVWLVCKLRRIPMVLEVRDLWPESAVQMGILRNRQMISVMGWMERTLYNQSKRIIALTAGIRQNICARGWSPDKVELVTCGVDFDCLHPHGPLRQLTRQQQGWEGKQVVMYFGALGQANNISVILRAAQSLLDRTDILFVLVGNGLKRESLRKDAADRKLSNVQFIDAVPKHQANAFLNGADVCLATLQDIPLFTGAIPTKLLDYMACAKPVLCGIRGEAADIVEAAGAGKVFDADDDQALVRDLCAILADCEGATAMGRAGLAYVKQFYSVHSSQEKTERILDQVVVAARAAVTR